MSIILSKKRTFAPCGAIATTLLAVAFTLSVGIAASAQTHTDERWGFKIRVPKDFRKIPAKPTERWIIGRYQSEKNYFTKDGWEFKPMMNLIIFPHSRKKGKRVEVEQSGDEITINWKQKYKDYKDYLKRNFGGGGYYFSLEEEGKEGGVDVTKYEIKVEKLANTKQRIVTWVYHLHDADLAVQVNLLEHRYKKMKNLAYRSLNSFKTVKRTKQPDHEAESVSGSAKATIGKEPKKLTPLERMRKRKEAAQAIIKKATDSLPKGWKVKKSKNYTVLTHVDARYTKKIINQAEAIRSWLDKNLGDIGEEYVPEAIIRICEDSDEENAYRSGSGFSFSTREILVSKKSFDRRYELEWMSQRLLDQFFADKNADLRNYLPGWVDNGLEGYIGSGIAKGKRLVFKPDEWEKSQLRKAEKEGHIVPCRDMIKMTGAEYRNLLNKSQWASRYQAASLVRYLYSPKCRRAKHTKHIVLEYLRNLNDIVVELRKKEEEEDKKKGRGAAKTEEEEEKRRKERAEKAKKLARYVVDEAFKRTFGEWTPANWKSLERGWAKAAL